MNWTRSVMFLCTAGLTALLVPRITTAGDISGLITFHGDSGGVHPIEIAAHTVFDTPPESATQVPSPGGAYTLLVDDGSYYISVYFDRDESGGPPNPDEPFVWYDANGDGKPDKVTVSGGNSIAGIDIELGYVYVDINAKGIKDGSSWADGFE